MFLSAFFEFTKTNAFKFFIASLFVLILIVILLLSYKKEVGQVSREYTIKRLTIVSIFSSISILLYIFGIDIKIFIPYMPSFLEIHFSLIPVFVIVAIYGVTYGSIAIIIRTLGKMLIVSSSSFGVGELADIIIGLAAIIVFSLFFSKNKTKKGLIYGLFASAVAWTITGVFINWTMIIPFYIYIVLDGNVAGLLGMLSTIPNITADNYMGVYLFVACLPFNAIAAGINSLLSYLTIRGLSKASIGLELEKSN